MRIENASMDCTSIQSTEDVPVLLVDDQPVNILALRKQLANIPGIQIYEASSGLEALEFAARINFGLILLDVQMPVMDGFEVANVLQSEGVKSPIIFVTAFGDDIERQLTGYNVGAVDYICKPVHPSILLRKVTVFLELYRSSQNLELQRQYYKQTLDHAFEGIIRTETNGVINYANDKALQLLDISDEKTLLGSVFDILPELRFQKFSQQALISKNVEIQRKKNDGKRLNILLNCSEIKHDGVVIGSVIMLQDISDTKLYEAKLLTASQKDSLTGLYNRDFFSVYLSKAMHRAQRQKCAIAVLNIDLNDFKIINDTLGHSAGDEIIRQTAKKIKQNIRESDLGARLGGDEFALILEDDKDKILQACMQVANNLGKSLGEIVSIRGSITKVSAAIGIAVYPDHGSNVQSLSEAADMAMYRAKTSGKAFEFYNPELRRTLESRNVIVNTLKNDDLHDVISVEYQPILYFDNPKHWGIEALARWRGSKNKPGPETFISIAEEINRIFALTECISEQVSREMLKFVNSPHNPSYIALNLSPVLLQHPIAFRQLLLHFEQCGWGNQSAIPLCLEITESTPVDFQKNKNNLQFFWDQLRKLGWKLAIDDFGAGHSSINYFESLPCSMVKLDKCLTHDVTTCSKRFRILQGVTDLAHDLGLTVIAEGIEDKDNLETIRAAGCDGVQGYYYSRPLPYAKLEQFELPKVG